MDDDYEGLNLFDKDDIEQTTQCDMCSYEYCDLLVRRQYLEDGKCRKFIKECTSNAI
jgi:hypothetical protein